MIIEVDNVNQAKSHKWVCHIFKNTLGTCLIPNFQRVINGHRYVRSGASKSGRVPQVGMSYSQKHTCHMFYTQFFNRNRLGMVSDMSEASKSCPSTSTTSTRPSTISGYYIFSKICMAHFLYPTFQEKSIINNLRYVLQVMLIDINVNQVESQ